MKHLFQNITIIDTHSPYHNQKVNLLINNDQIAAIGANVDDDKAKKIDLNGCMVSPGWVEMHADFAEPGFEERENIKSGAAAAVAGGFTTVALMPTTHPVVQTKSDVEFILRKGDETAVNIYPLGALTQNCEGNFITEMYDMHQSGALGFYDGKKAVKNPNVLKNALLYAKNIGPVLLHPRHPDLTQGAQMNEGQMSTFLGLKGFPALSEALMIKRDLFIAEYAQSPVHFSTISTKESIALIREAKANGQPVTCDVAFYNLIFEESVLEEYDTNFKLNPPIRTADDKNALVEGLKDGTIDAISTDHLPLDIEHKRCEFSLASFGMAAIESAFSALNPVLKNIGIERFVNAISSKPRQILDLPQISLKEGSMAELTFFSTAEKSKITKQTAQSKAANNPFLNQEQTGKIKGIFNKGKYIAVK